LKLLFCCSIENFQPGLVPNSELKADEMQVTPAIANARVACWRFVSSLLVIFSTL
jgi:hypothetical protein